MAAVSGANGTYGYTPTSGPSSQASSPTSPTFHTHGRVQQQAAGRPSTPSSSNGGSVSLEPPSGLSYLDFVRGWSDGHVAAWLASCRCGSHAGRFATNDIRGDVLLDIDQNTLREMGIASVGDRARIVNAIKQLRSKCHASKLLVAPRVTRDPPAGAPAEPLTRVPSKRIPPPLTLKPAGSRTDVELVGRTPRQGVSTPNSAHGTTPISKDRPFLGPLPPVPRSQPPAAPAQNAKQQNQVQTPPQQQQRASNLGVPALQTPQTGRRTPTPEPPPYTSHPLPPAPNGSNTPGTPSTGRMRDGGVFHPGLPSNPGQFRGNAVNHSPVTTTRNPRAPLIGHNKSGSLSRPGAHPYATTLEPPLLKTIDLSPIAETFQSPAVSTPNRLVAPPNIITGRPSTPLSQQTGYDELRRKTIKFHLEESGRASVVNIFDSDQGVDVLERVLKKFGKAVNSPVDPEYTPEGWMVLEGYAVFFDDSLLDSRPLTEAQLLSVCRADPGNPARDLGLHLRPIASFQQRQRTITTASMEETKRLNRASSVSILSSLGVRDPERALLTVNSPTVAQQSPVSPSRSKLPKLRNFFGQRPPSELIHNHVQEYFPFTDRKVLKRTQRNSILRQNTTASRRDSRIRRDSTWLPVQPSRFSTSTVGSRSRASMETIPRGGSPPPVPNKDDGSPRPPRMALSIEDGDVVDISADDDDNDDYDYERDRSRDQSPQLPQIQSTEPLAFPSIERRGSVSSRRSRMSYLSELRRNRDTSDTASMLTVDEITQEVESRRVSYIGSTVASSMEGATLAHGSDEDEDDGRSIRRKSAIELEVPQAASETDDEDDEEDEDEDDEDEDENGDEDDSGEENPPEDVENDDDKPIKWIRGALIGAGSFGSVYLGMDKVNGMLMAVKQVELPSGSTHNEERKKSMLTALEREIDLLKQLQHENIVQYLDSFMDKQHLNIFLEYVPGGSVSALLNKFGAFEEALVRNFVRQILQGLDYLHTSGIIHRDIKGANILVDNKGGIKISDFGISKKVADNILSTTRAHRPSLQGSVFWMAPEVVKQTSYTLKADIWSLGCLVVEMFTGEHPFPKLNQMQAIFQIGRSARPQTPEDISPEAEEFLNLTFETDYDKRPAAAELLLNGWIVKDPANPARKSKTAAADP